MIRRARLSFKPNVRPGGRAPGSAGSARDGGVATDAEPALDPGKETAGPWEGSIAPTSGGSEEVQPGEGSQAERIEAAATVGNELPSSKTPSAPLQRRKRISTLPNLAKPRVSNSASAVVPPPKPSQADVTSTPPVIPAPCKNEGSVPEKGKVLSPQKSQVPVSSLQGQHVTLPEKRTPVPQVPQFSPYKKSVLKHTEVGPTKAVECAQTEEPSPLKERPSQKSCSNELFEVIKKTTQKKLITTNLEKERLKRAQKLRDLLRSELRKERKAWKEKHPLIDPMVEPEKSKMTVRDFIYFIPTSNPMSSSIEENKSSEKSSPVESPPTGLVVKNSAEDDDLDDDDVEDDDSQLLAPRVKVAEDGSIILDEESLTVEVSRNKAPIVEGNDPIFERGSTTTYSSFRKKNYSKPWSDKETDMFFLAISMVGTDFSMIGQLFPHRERIEIKNKFKREERINAWRIDKAFRETKDFDFEFFAHLLEKALEAGKKNKTKSIQPRKTSAKSRKKQKDKTAEQSLCDESVISDEEGADAGTAEKENKRSLDVDDCSGVADHVSVKKKRSKRKKENTKEPEVENESQDDDLTYKPKKKSTKRKTTVQDTDNAAELQSVDDGSLKETPAVKKTRVQKNKPDYKESEFEDDENDADFDITEDFEVEDVHNAGEVEPTTETKDEACEEENSLVLFSEEGDYQSGPDDLSSLKQSLSEVNEAVSQASDVCLVASNSMLGDPEPVSVAQEETSHSACDQFDISAKASNVGSEQDSESKDKQKILQGRRARPAPNLSKASVKKEVSPEEQSEAKPQADPSADLDVGKSDKVQKEDVGVDQQRQADESAKADYSSPSHNGHEESSVKPPIPGRGRLPRPEPNLPVRTSTRKAKLDITDSKDIEGVEKCAPNKTEDTKSIKREGDVSSVDKHRQEGSSPVKKDVASDPSQAEESKTVQLACDRRDTGKEKPSLPVRGRLRPKPNLTRAPAKQKSSDTEQEVQHSQVSHVDIKSPSHTPSRDGENEVKERVESSMPQDECGKSNIKPAPLAPGRFQRPKPNLIKASSRKEAFDVKEDSSAPSAAHAAGDAGRDLQSDSPSGKQENEKLLNTVSESSQDSCKSEINSHPSSSLQLIQDSPVNQDHLTEASCISETKSVQSPINPAPLPRGQLQRPKPNLLRSSGRKGELEMKESESLEASSGAVEKRSPTGLVKEVPSLLLHTQESCAEKPGSMLPLKVDDENLKEEPNTLLKPALLPKGRFQRPKPNLLRAAAKRDRLPSPDEPKDVRKGEARVESAVESTDTTSNIPVSEMETTPMPLKSNKSLVAEDDSVTLEKIENGASVDSTPAMIDKGQSASDDERKALKPVLTRATLQRSKPNLSKSVTSGADTADLLSTVQEEEQRTGTTSTDIIGPNIKLDVEVLSGGDAEMKLSAVKDTCDEAVVKALAQPKEAISNVKQGEAASLKPVRTRFTKPSPNLGRAAMRKETSSTEPKTLVPKKGQETVKGIDDDPELLKVEDMPDTSNTGHGCKEAGHVIEKKSAAIKPAQLKRGRLIRLLPNLVKPSTKTLSPLQSKTNEDLNSSPTIKDKDHVVATSSPANKRKASDSNVDLSPKKLCSSGTPQKPPCLSASEVVQGSLSNEPPSSSPSSSVQDTATPPLSRFGRPLRKLSTAPSASPKSGTSSDRPEKEKAVRNVKSPTTKVSKPMSSKSKGKTTLVKIRATQQQEDDEEDADLGFEDENYDLSPDMQNLAPVFVPFSLRSPKPVTAEIEETVEELEIPVELVDLPNSITLDLGRTPFQHVMDPAEAHPEKSGQCDGSAEAAMTLISMGSSVYEPMIGEFSPDRCTENIMSSMRRDNQEERSSPKRFSSSSNRPHVCATESCVTQDPRIVESPHSAPNLENQAQSDAVSSAENLPDPVNDAIEERSCPVMPGDAQQHAFTSQDVSVSDCLLGEHGTGEEATFILTLVEIPINDDYAYSCDSNVAESLPAPLFISSGSSQALTQNLNASVETVSYEPCVVGQDVKDLMFSRKRSAQCLDDGHDSPPQKKPHVSEQVVEMEIKSTAVDIDGDGKVAHKVSVTEPKPEVSQIGVIALRERPPNSPAAKTCSTVPVEMPGMSMADSLDRNLPLAYASPLSTLKTPLKRPGRKPLGFLSLVCKEKQSKKANEENRKQKAVPRLQCRKSSPRVRGPQKESTDLNIENVSDSEVPSSSPIFSPAEMQNSTTEDAEAVPSTSQISDNQEPQPSSKSHDLSTEEEAAPVSEYFFSDIFMEVDD